jgi:hypothetical protein
MRPNRKRQLSMSSFVLWVGLAGAVLLVGAGEASAFRVTGEPGAWLRWDAAPRQVSGEERSLAGGLRYSIEGGSYEALRDQFMWLPSTPSVEDFERAIARAFENWTVVDPATGLPSGFYFVEDLETVAIDEPGDPFRPASFLGANPGAEIDLFAETPHAGPQFAASVVVFVDPTPGDLTLTSGTTDYPGYAIAGADIRINPGYVWSLRGFEVLLTHEIGHALGLGDLEFSSGLGGGSGFIDDDYDPTTSASAAATLTNSFALEIDPLDPDASPLQTYPGDLDGDPGLDSEGVTLLMETDGIFDLLDLLLPPITQPLLQNDEFAGRQFLYPVAVPEPSFGSMVLFGAVGLALRRFHRRRLQSRTIGDRTAADSRRPGAAHGRER